MKNRMARLLIGASVALVAVIPIIGSERPSRNPDIEYIFELSNGGLQEDMEAVQLAPEEVQSLLDNAPAMDEVLCRGVVLGDVLGEEVPVAWRSVPVVSMAETHQDIGEIIRQPNAQVFIGGIPWYLIPPEQSPNKSKKNCVSDAFSCAATGANFCAGKGSSLKVLAFLVPKGDPNHAAGACQVQCMDGSYGAAKMCGSLSGSGVAEGCPCASDPCKWGTDACCQGVPPPWCK